MTTTARQDKEFLETVINPYLLEAAVAWINDNMDPEDVFDVRKLEAWADNNEYVLED